MKSQLAPRVNVNDPDMEVVQWYVEECVWVEVGQDLLEVSTSKAAVEVQAEHAGYVVYARAPGERVQTGELVATFHETVDDATSHRAQQGQSEATPLPPTGPSVEIASSAEKSTPAHQPASLGPLGVTRFSKSALRLLGETGRSPADFADQGLVTTRILRELLGDSDDRPASQSGAADMPPHLHGLRSEVTPRSKALEIEALSVGAGDHLTSTLTFRYLSAGVAARLATEDRLDGMVLPIVLHELARLLPDWPGMNAFYTDGSVRYYDAVRIGLALDMGLGLKVVTLDGPSASPEEMFETMLEVGERYLQNALRPDELVGSTFTVTDLSGFDVMSFVPLINGRQSIILGIGGDSAAPGHPLTFNFTFDHRVLSGAEVARFMRSLRGRLDAHGTSASDDEIDVARHRALVFEGNHCDECFTDLRAYHDEYGRDAHVQVVVDRHACLLRVCHRCASGY